MQCASHMSTPSKALPAPVAAADFSGALCIVGTLSPNLSGFLKPRIPPWSALENDSNSPLPLPLFSTSPRLYQLIAGVSEVTVTVCYGLFGFNVFFLCHAEALIYSVQCGSKVALGILLYGWDKFSHWGDPGFFLSFFYFILFFRFLYLYENAVHVGPLRSELS